MASEDSDDLTWLPAASAAATVAKALGKKPYDAQRTIIAWAAGAVLRSKAVHVVTRGNQGFRDEADNAKLLPRFWDGVRTGQDNADWAAGIFSAHWVDAKNPRGAHNEAIGVQFANEDLQKRLEEAGVESTIVPDGLAPEFVIAPGTAAYMAKAQEGEARRTSNRERLARLAASAAKPPPLVAPGSRSISRAAMMPPMGVRKTAPSARLSEEDLAALAEAVAAKIGPKPRSNRESLPSVGDAEIQRWFERLTPEEQSKGIRWLWKRAKDDLGQVMRKQVEPFVAGRKRGRPSSR